MWRLILWTNGPLRTPLQTKSTCLTTVPFLPILVRAEVFYRVFFFFIANSTANLSQLQQFIDTEPEATILAASQHTGRGTQIETNAEKFNRYRFRCRTPLRIRR
jgi:hypothetical protein